MCIQPFDHSLELRCGESFHPTHASRRESFVLSNETDDLVRGGFSQHLPELTAFFRAWIRTVALPVNLLSKRVLTDNLNNLRELAGRDIVQAEPVLWSLCLALREGGTRSWCVSRGLNRLLW